MSTAPPSTSRASWLRAAAEVQQDLQLGLGLLVLLLLSRVVLFAFFHGRMAPTSTLTDVAAVLARGLRFDGRTAALFVVPLLAASLLCGFVDLRGPLRWLRRWYARLAGACTVVITVVDVCYFQEFGDQFNTYAFNILYDDAWAVVKTAVGAYPVGWLLPLMFVLAALVGLSLSFVARFEMTWLRRRLEGLARPARVLSSMGAVMLVTFGMVGRHDRVLKVRRDAQVGTDELLNKLVLNPYLRLYYATKEHVRMVRGSDLSTFLPDGNVALAAQRHLALSTPPRDLDQALLRTAPGGAPARPRHVFLIVMESYSTWTLLPRYQALGLSEGLADLARRGLSVPRVLSSGHTTISSLTQLFTGLPDAGIAANYLPSAAAPFPSSLAPTMERLGYKSRFLTGSQLSWQFVGDFARNQGFDEVLGSAAIPGGTVANWGVPDAQLFDFVKGHVDPAVSSFNLILTTTNHAPFDLPETGYPVSTLPTELAKDAENPVPWAALGHHYYADRELARFVAAMEKRCPGSLFVITGDHAGRVFVQGHPTLFEELAVPLVFYGPEVLGDQKLAPGVELASHLDLIPSLMHLTASAGFEYHALGTDLFAGPAPTLAFGRNAALSADAVVDFGHPPGSGLPPRVQRGGEAPSVDALQARLNDLLAIAWQRVRVGPALK